MLIDALVFGVYKCVSSLLDVSVLLLLELDLKRVLLCRRVFLTLPQEDAEAAAPATSPLRERRLRHQRTNERMHKEGGGVNREIPDGVSWL